ncbi:MAG: hypothetical protein LC772_01480, partial [Chloroflexi bacterium]|nr:hypothetical protein [Chloroflexota bacterium]
RRPVVNAGWGLLGFRTTAAAETKGTPEPQPTKPGARTKTAAVVSPAVLPPTTPSAAQTPSDGVSYPAVLPVPAQPQPLVRPAVADTGVQYKVDGTLAPGVPQVVTVAVTSRKDMLLDSAIDVSLTPGARFITDSGSRPDAARTVWTGNLVQGLPASVPVTLVAARPGLYDVRVTVRSGGRQVGASDLLLPIGMAPSSDGVNVNTADPISLYSVVESLAAQSARPIAVEEGLSGTRTVSLKAHNLRSALDTSAAQFGCAVDEQNGVDHILLHAAS